jgi:hypothetical protein
MADSAAIWTKSLVDIDFFSLWDLRLGLGQDQYRRGIKNLTI